MSDEHERRYSWSFHRDGKCISEGTTVATPTVMARLAKSYEDEGAQLVYEPMWSS